MSIEFAAILLIGAVMVAAAWFYEERLNRSGPAPRIGDPDAPEEPLPRERLGSLDVGMGPSAPAPDDPLPDPSLVSRPAEGSIQNVNRLETLLADDPDDPELLNMLAYHHYSERRLDDAIVLFRRGLVVKPGDATMLFYLGNALFLKGDLPEAERNWREVLSRSPGARIADKARQRLAFLERSPSG